MCVLCSQVDPFKCSCSLLPLVSWLKSQQLKGVSCIDDGGNLFTIMSLQVLCRGLKGQHLYPTEVQHTNKFYILLGGSGPVWQIKASKKDGNSKVPPNLPNLPVAPKVPLVPSEMPVHLPKVLQWSALIVENHKFCLHTKREFPERSQPLCMYIIV